MQNKFNKAGYTAILSWTVGQEQFCNKAGYTATSCGQVGRGGNACFHTFQLDQYDRPTDRWTNGPTDGQSLL